MAAQIYRPGPLPPPLPPPPARAEQPEAPPAFARPDVPADEWHFKYIHASIDGPWRRLRGKAEILGIDMVFRADEIDYNEQTSYVEARGNVFFQHFARNEQVWADRVEYNIDEEKGKFYSVRGVGPVRVDARPGILTSTSPLYFQGEWAERLGSRYVLYNGFITNCKMPRPWWRLRGPRFEIVPGERAVARNSVFLLRKFPLFYTPYFYKSLQKVPRRSGFLMPNIGNSSRRGKMIGIGYFWAINRSYDATYRLQDFTTRGLAHHLELRGKPRAGTDFDAIFYGVQDRGLPLDGGGVRKEGGASVYVAGKSDLGHGFTAVGQGNHISTLRFRQAFSESFNEQIFSEVHSVGAITKNWSRYVFNAVVARVEDFQRQEVENIDPVTQKTILQPDSVIIRKLPEFSLSGRERRIVRGPLPVWVSFGAAAGLVYRSQSVFENDLLIERYQTGRFMNRLDFQPRLTTLLRWKGWSLVPAFAVRETYYGESQTAYQDRFRVAGANLTRSVRDLSADLIAPSLARVFDKKSWLGDKAKHVIEPRVSVRYTSGVGEDFNRVIRFDAADLVSDTKYAELRVTNRILAKRGDQVADLFTWDLAQRYYFDPAFGGAVLDGRRNVFASTADLTPYAFVDRARNLSPIVSVFRATPKPGFDVEWRADIDPRRGQVVDSGLSANARFSKYFVSVGHSQVHSVPALSPSANQMRGTVGFGDQNRRGWSAAFQAIYDYRAASLLYAVTQVTYNTDCCGFSVQVRRFSFGTRHETQPVLAFSVANIGSFGTLKKQERLF